MIAVDTSAIVAVVLGEPDAERHLERLQHGPAQMSSVSLVEATIVVDARQGADAVRDLELLVDATIGIVAVDTDHSRAAIAEWLRFGRGRHPAAGRDGQPVAQLDGATSPFRRAVSQRAASSADLASTASWPAPG